MEAATKAAPEKHRQSAEPQRKRDASPAPAVMNPFLTLQQQAGNQAVQQLLRAVGVQTKLAVSQPDDPEERQADQVAKKVMRAHAGFPISSPCACSSSGEQCDECKSGGSAIHRSATRATAPPHVPRTVSDTLRSSGHPIDGSSRAFFEPRFGRDFSQVRIHTDSTASQSARSIGARAYAAGEHIVFDSSSYAPHTSAGQELMAHELAHVVQQSDAPRSQPSAIHRSILDDVVDDVVDDVESLGSGVGNVVSSAVDTVTDVGQAALSWIETEAGKAALAAASAIARALGGTVKTSGTGIEIDFDDINIAEVEDETFVLPLGIPITTFFEKDFKVGDFVIEAWAGEMIGDPEITMAIGPVRLQNLKLILDPTAGTYLGNGKLFVGSALVGSAEKNTSVEVGAAGVLPFEVPIPIWGSADGGIRTILRLDAKEDFTNSVTVGYTGGNFVFHSDIDMKLGALAQLDHEAYLRVEIESEEICSVIWPLSSKRLWDGAVEINVPVTLAAGSGGKVAKIGSVTASKIPISDIETLLEGDHAPEHCMSLEELVDFLCKKKKLPEDVCALLPHKTPPGGGGVGPHAVPVAPGGGGGVPPGGGGGVPGGGGGVSPLATRPKIYIDPTAYPESAQHAREAINRGKRVMVTIDRPRASSRRRSSVGAYKSKHDCDGKGHGKPPCTKPGQQYDEYPQALFQENFGNADVKPISGSDNGGSGASIGNQCRPYADSVGVQVVIAPIP